MGSSMSLQAGRVESLQVVKMQFNDPSAAYIHSTIAKIDSADLFFQRASCVRVVIRCDGNC